MQKFNLLTDELAGFEKNCTIIKNKDGKYVSVDGRELPDGIFDALPHWIEEIHEYQSGSPDIKIVILQRGWCMVGKFERNGTECKLFQASVIRIWGTTRGLGEIAQNGPTEDTRLDPCHNGESAIEFDYLTVVAC